MIKKIVFLLMLLSSISMGTVAVADATSVNMQTPIEGISTDTLLSFAKLIVALITLMVGLKAYNTWRRKELFEFYKSLIGVVSPTCAVLLHTNFRTVDVENLHSGLGIILSTTNNLKIILNQHEPIFKHRYNLEKLFERLNLLEDTLLKMYRYLEKFGVYTCQTRLFETPKEKMCVQINLRIEAVVSLFTSISEELIKLINE